MLLRRIAIRHIFIAFLLFCIFMTIGYALVAQPKYIHDYKTKNDDVIGSLTSGDIDTCIDCDISDDGLIKRNSSEAYIEFVGVNKSFSSVSVTISPESKIREIDIVINGKTENIVKSYRFQKGEILSFNTPKSYASSITLKADGDYRLISLNFHSGSAEEVALRVPIWIIITIALTSLVLSIAVVMIDIKMIVSERIIDYIKNHKKNILVFIISTVICIAIAAIITLIASLFLKNITAPSVFYKRLFVFVFGCVFAILLFVINGETIKDKPEKIVAGLILISGIVMIIVSPVGHTSWDTESHYRFALNASHIGRPFVVSQADYAVIGVDPHYDVDIPDTSLKNVEDINYLENIKNYPSDQTGRNTTIAHIPSGIVLAIGRLFNLPFYKTIMLAKLPNLLIYAFCCYFAIKTLKSGKMILSVIALFPINIFLASNFSYDYWVTGFTLLGMAYFVLERQTSGGFISKKNIIIMCLSLAVGSIPKLVYAPLMVFPFFIKPQRIKNKNKYYLFCVLTAITLLVLFLIRSYFEMKNGGDMRGGADVNSVAQLKFVLFNPLKYTKILLNFLSGYLSIAGMNNYISFFAYLGKGIGHEIFAVLLIYASATDKNEYDLKASGAVIRTIAVCIFMTIISATATALYLAFTPVGNDTILGCQSRYIIPTIYPLAALMGSGKIVNRMNRTTYNNLFLIPCAIIIFFDICALMLIKWI